MELINQRNLDSLRTVVADDVVRHSNATPGVIVTNLDEFKAFLETDFAVIPDSVMVIDMIFSAGDKVAVRAYYSGTQTGQMGPYPPSDKTVKLVFIGILRIENGKIAEIWVEWDNVSVLAQLGHLPPPTSRRGGAPHGSTSVGSGPTACTIATWHRLSSSDAPSCWRGP